MTAWLLSTGVAMTVLGAMDSSFLSPRILLVNIAVIFLFEIISFSRITAVIGIIAAAAGTAVPALSPEGARTLSDLTIAVSLRIHGIRTALPLIQEPAMMITACVITVLCCLACIRKATCLPAVLLVLASSLIIWLTDRMDLIPWILPGLVALMMLLMTSRFQETSVLRVIPWSAVVVLAAFLLAGSGASVPALRDKADEFRRSVLDRLFFTEARDVFSLSSVGFSPHGPDQLGGKPNPDNSPVMIVSTPRKAYLRGSVYDEYTGHSWLNNAGGRRYLWQSAQMEPNREDLFNQDLPAAEHQNPISQTTTLTVRMLGGSTSTLFVPQRVRELIPGSDMVPYFSNSSEVFITRNLKPGDTYSVVAPLYSSFDKDIGDMIEICGQAGEDGRLNRILSEYTALPPGIHQSVVFLAADIVRNKHTPFSKALSIQEYLSRNYTYSLDVDDPPSGEDFVSSFLMDTKEGYCTYFASAMTVLCRLNGLPARYVEGYSATPGSDGEAYVTGMDAHAWTEVYFKGFGWLTFDPTPGQQPASGNSGDAGYPDSSAPPEATPDPYPEPTPKPTPEPDDVPQQDPEPSSPPETTAEPDDPTPTPVPEQQTPEPGQTPESSETPNPGSNSGSNGERPSPNPGQDNDRTPAGQGAGTAGSAGFPWFVIPAILLLMLIIRIIITSPSFRERFAQAEERKTHIWIQEISDLLSADNMRRKTGETPLGFAERADKTGVYSTQIRPVGEIVSLMAYSRIQADPGTTALVRDTAVMLKSEISKPARLRYWIRRIFRSVKKRSWTKQ